MPKKTKTNATLDPVTLQRVLRLVRERIEVCEKSARTAGREGGVMLQHAASEWARATEAGTIEGLIERMLDAEGS
jgi:hypothetical protein